MLCPLYSIANRLLAPDSIANRSTRPINKHSPDRAIIRQGKIFNVGGESLKLLHQSKKLLDDNLTAIYTFLKPEMEWKDTEAVAKVFKLSFMSKSVLEAPRSITHKEHCRPDHYGTRAISFKSRRVVQALFRLLKSKRLSKNKDDCEMMEEDHQFVERLQLLATQHFKVPKFNG